MVLAQHSNGKYGLRIFDVYEPTKASVFQGYYLWRNGHVGWTATVAGKVSFDNFVAVENGGYIYEGREANVYAWSDYAIRNSFFVDYTGLLLGTSFASFSDDFETFAQMGGPQEGGLLMPWNRNGEGGVLVSNCTFVNFRGACIRGCAHCGRGGSPVFGDGAFETRFSGMRFVNSTQRALFRHPNEAVFYDLDGTLTGTGIVEDYSRGGFVRGSSFVGTSVLLPPRGCYRSSLSTLGTGGSVCVGILFKRLWFKIVNPALWSGKALCVRPSWANYTSMCQSLRSNCNCLPFLKKQWRENVFLAAEGLRYNLQVKSILYLLLHSALKISILKLKYSPD
jgi:hypothetical protein